MKVFCSESSRRRGESLYGTASRVKTWMLLEYPGVWRSDAIEGSALPDKVKRRLAELRLSNPGLRQVFVRQSHRRSETMRCFLVNSSEIAPGALQLDLSTCDEAPEFDFSTVASDPRTRQVDEPILMVCTHGNHDKCCAKFGIPLYEELTKLVGHRAWQCSHIGGDRFAGNLICLPHGIYYGHVTPQDLPAIVDAYLRGAIHLPNYRGRSCYPIATQVGEYFVRQQSGRVGIDDFTFEGGTRGGHWAVRFTGHDGVHEVTFRARNSRDEVLTCKSETPRPVAQYELLSYTTPDRMSV